MPRETKHYRNVNENPCNMCMPMGGILPFKGIEDAMVIIHGSQGCSTYMRRHIAEHYNEPIDVGSSSLNEKGTIYGGSQNLFQALDNIRKVYKPRLIGILTSCLAETIGEDVEGIARDYLKQRGLDDFPLVAVSTPGYGGTHSEGYWLAVKKTVVALARPTEKHDGINVIVPNLSPADIREIKRILELMDIKYTLLPDISETLDRPIARPYTKIPPGGTKVEAIRRMPGAAATIQFGITVEENVSPGRYLQSQFGVPLYNLPVPMGVEATDMFVGLLAGLAGGSVPKTLELERGRLLDCMVDSHKYNAQGRGAVFGDPELVYAVVRTCAENGLYPAVVATGSGNTGLEDLLEPVLADCPGEVRFHNETDFAQIRTTCRETGVNIAIGHSDGKYLTEKEGIPLARMGFPIHDRVGGQRLLSVGYTGTTMFLDRITNTLLEYKHKNYRAAMYRKFYRNTGIEERGHTSLMGQAFGSEECPQLIPVLRGELR
ncbi:nitrogenase component 1 [Desulfoscipio geothermicus]|uniref:Nitrogenase molybdenum-iron protein NifN n=1 Tax=Desulfoscipio geothermicus DSM 3669 TaxID=1121426 RepID=A0A1I6ECR0_9FIRM|nr:nitrogenase component 1 [Desulfoscipio geothermicus]SFR15536.1 nitrogenase molybdenum-iron protein NifN [Desulfoscipio geothermicus DSM 3669]